MAFCIPRHVSEKLLKAAKVGEIDVVKLYSMDSTQRRSFFEGYTTKENAEGINAGFEKVIASGQQKQLDKWVNDIFDPSEKKTQKFKDVTDRVNAMKEQGIIGENAEGFYQDLIASELGVTVSETEMNEIIKKSENLDKLYKETNKFGLPNVEYFKAKADMQNYLHSLVPSSQLKVLTSTIFRGTMLVSPKSALTNIAGNSVQGLYQSLERRLSSNQYQGSNPGLVRDYVNYARTIYHESGYDVTRAITLSEDSKISGEDIVHSQGKGAVRALGRVYEDWIFKRMLGAPDVVFSAIAFADTANLASTKLAQKEGLTGEAMKKRAAEIFTDATQIEPKTVWGQAIRSQGIADAQYSTFTNDSMYSSFALGIRGLFNLASGDLRVGDQIMPFVKTPANVIGAGLDAAGLSAIISTYNLKSAVAEFKDGNVEPMRGVVRGYIRSGLGLTLAFILSNLFDPDDFIGEYPTSEKERQLLEQQNATPNSLKIGDKWVSLDYFGPIGAPLVGMLYARKYGTNIPDTVYRYGQGVITQSTKIPGFDQFYDTIETLKNNRPDSSKSLEENISGVGSSAVDFLSARVIPAIVYDIAKATDGYERKASKDKPLEKVQAKLPILRNQLPKDQTVLGDERRTESPLSLFLFGSRVKTARITKVTEELNRLDSTGNLPSITDVEKTSERVKEFKKQVSPEVYRKAMDEFGKNFGTTLERAVVNPRYTRLDDEKKADAINKIKTDKLELTLRKYGYKKPKKAK